MCLGDQDAMPTTISLKTVFPRAVPFWNRTRKENVLNLFTTSSFQRWKIYWAETSLWDINPQNFSKLSLLHFQNGTAHGKVPYIGEL